MTRYFMTVREAVELVLQAAVLGVTMHDRQECIFVLDMGQPVRITELALQMIRLAGLRPHEDIKIVYTGLRPGEKFYEELFHFSENAVKTAHESIFLASPRFTDMAVLRPALDALLLASGERKTAEALALLKRMVPEFPTLHPFSAYRVMTIKRALISVSDKTGLIELADSCINPASKSSRPAARQKRCATRGYPSSTSPITPAFPKSWTGA